MIRRYERDRRGELLHVDVKKLGRIPDGGGHNALGRQAGRDTAAAWDSTTSTPPWTTNPPGLQRDPRRRKGRHLRRLLTRAAAFFAGHGIDRGVPWRSGAAAAQTGLRADGLDQRVAVTAIPKTKTNSSAGQQGRAPPGLGQGARGARVHQ